MKSEEFDALIDAQVGICQAMLKIKGAEYATHDRLNNFRKAAHLQGITLRQALCGMMAKHVVSVFDMCNDNEIHPQMIWDEKITDNINYLLLLSAIIQEEDDLRRKNA